MGGGDVLDVDVVPYAGAVGGGVVVAEDARGVPRLQAFEDHRDEVEDAGVGQLGGGRARDVEVAQRGGPDAVGPGGGVDQPLAGQLGLAVGAQRQTGGVLRDEVHIGHAVDGGGGGEDEAADAGGRHGLQEGREARDVLPVVVERPLHRLRDLFLARDVHHACHSMVTNRALQEGSVEHAADHQRDPVGDAVGAAGGQVVVDDDVFPAADEGAHHMRADVPGSARDQPAHPHASQVFVTGCRLVRGPRKIESGTWGGIRRKSVKRTGGPNVRKFSGCFPAADSSGRSRPFPAVARHRVSGYRAHGNSA